MIPKRPRCKYCNRRITLKSNPWPRTVPRLSTRAIPIYCPNCGKEIDSATRDQLYKYDNTMLQIQRDFGIIVILTCLITFLLINYFY